MQGIALEVKDPVPGSGERIDPDLTLHNLREVFSYRGLLRKDGTYDTSVYKDENATHLVHNYAVAYLRVAEALMDQGDVDGAKAALQQAAQISPDFHQVRYALGTLYLHARRYPEAESYLQSIIEQGIRDPMVYHDLGRAQEAQGKMEDAEASYRRALDGGPDDFESMRDLFSFLWQAERKHPEAYQVLVDWNHRHPEDQRVAAALQEFADSAGVNPPPTSAPPAGRGLGR